MGLDSFLRSVQQGPPAPAYYFHGDEDVLKDEAIEALLDRTLDAGSRDFNLDRRSAADLDAEALHALVNTPPLLAERRVVVVRDAEELRRRPKVRDELLRYLGDPNPTTVLALIQGAGEDPDRDLAAKTVAVAVEPLPPDRVRRWIAHHAKRLGLALDPGAVDHLLAAAGHDLGTLAREIEKLAALSGDGPVTTEAVAALVGQRPGATVDDLVAATLARDGRRAAALVAPVLELGGVNGVRVLQTLGTALVGTALARAELDRGTSPRALVSALFAHIRAARPFGLGDWNETADRWAAWARRWTSPELADALRRALATDRALKNSTVSDDQGLLLELVAALAVPEAA